MEASTIKLFKAVPIDAKLVSRAMNKFYDCSDTIRHGFILSPYIYENYTNEEVRRIIKLVKAEYGISAAEINSSFHKSWSKVRDASTFQLIIEQLAHYITTYGYEAWGIYDSDTVYIPNEICQLPQVNIDELKITVIHGLTREEIREKTLKLLSSGIALKEDTKQAVFDIITQIGIDDYQIEKIANKEIRAMIYDFTGIIPSNPTEFFRYLIYKTTGETLIIKNVAMIEKIKQSDGYEALALLHRYKKQYGFKQLASIFNRFKPLFLAFKKQGQMNNYINQISKLSKKHHKPMPVDYLNSLTRYIRDGDVSVSRFRQSLEETNIFRKIRLLYSLHYRLNDNAESIVYRIRNGKTFSSELKPFSFDESDIAEMCNEIIYDSIAHDVEMHVKDKIIYIPEGINYALPATEKQFSGNFPTGTYIECEDNITAGVHWFNKKHQRVDLDLSLVSITDKIGWDAAYRTAGRDVLFSGDVTDAKLPRGASELFYVDGDGYDAYMMFLNYYNFEDDNGEGCPFKLVVGKSSGHLCQNYMLDPSQIVGACKSNMDVKERALGFIMRNKGITRFYFNEMNMGRGITSGHNEHTTNTIKYLAQYYMNMISLNDMLEFAGATITHDKTDEYDIDLSPETVDKTTFIELLTGE